MKNTTRLLVLCVLVILLVVCIIIVAHEDRERSDDSVSGNAGAVTETHSPTASPVPPVSGPVPTPPETTAPVSVPAPAGTDIPHAQDGGGGLLNILLHPAGGQS